MEENSQLSKYVLLIKIRETFHRQSVKYEKMSNNPIISSKETIRFIRKAEYKRKRCQQISAKLIQMADELKLSLRDKMCLSTYGMTQQEAEREAGYNKKEQGRNLEILHTIFMKNCK